MATVRVPVFDFDNTFARELPELCVEWEADRPADPRIVVVDDRVACDLGIQPEELESSNALALLTGDTASTGITPVAMAYAGHQFGGYSPRLGDGRALLIGEVLDDGGTRRDVHLKGSGRTPFARGGDGKAALGPMLREFLIAEALHALGVPTTRALAVLTTGEDIMRDGAVPGALLVRVAASHLRVGTFEYAARLGDQDVLRRLADHAIARHHPAAAGSPSPNLALLESVVEVQAELVAHWMLLGFIHGVMNTDNTTISGEGIDYGPCAFMDRYDPSTVYSSIDHAGRYAYGNQPRISLWNLSRLAETLLPLIDDDVDKAKAAAIDVLESFPDRYREHWLRGMRSKLGLRSDGNADAALCDDFVALLQDQRLDYTSSFRKLGEILRGDTASLAGSDAERWVSRWLDRVGDEQAERHDVAAEIDRVNPLYIPRNHLIEEALDAATDGDLAPLAALRRHLTNPYSPRPGGERYERPAPKEFDRGYRTFCGT